jgi:hypothetical protein
MDEKYIYKFIWDSPRHRKEFHKKIESNMAYLLNPSSIKKIGIITSEIEKLGQLPRNEKQALLGQILLGYCDNDIHLFSMNSSSLTQNPSILRDKPQYRKITYLNNKVKQIAQQSETNISYQSILPDYDPNFPFSRFETAWENNRLQIEKVSGIKIERLSQMVPERFEEIKANLGDYLNIDILNKEIEKHSKSASNIINFEAPKDFSKNQILTYTTTGIILEELMPRGILLDVQKRCYPFEQPFYNFGRKEKLPMILCGQDIPDGNGNKSFNWRQITNDL